jgi:hypothetical protein
MASELEIAMIEVLEGFPKHVLAFACHGQVTKQDYDNVLIPAVTKALRDSKKVRLYYETARDFAGIDPGAVLKDTQVGISHLLSWERFAVVTDVQWIRHAMQLFGFMVPCELKVFATDEVAQAREWIAA